jgi:hypothetical protein
MRRDLRRLPKVLAEFQRVYRKGKKAEPAAVLGKARAMLAATLKTFRPQGAG